MCLHNQFARFMCIVFLLMFIFVYLSDYKTWLPRRKHRKRKKKTELKIK